MEYVTPKDKAAEWGISKRRVEILCGNDRVSGAYRLGEYEEYEKYKKAKNNGRVLTQIACVSSAKRSIFWYRKNRKALS